MRLQEDEALTRAEHGTNEATLKALASVKRLELENKRLQARVKELEHQTKHDSITKVSSLLFWFGVRSSRLWVADWFLFSVVSI